MYYIYMLRCEDNSIYTGITVDLERRMREHFNQDEKCAKYTKRHKPVKLESAWKSENRATASKLEYLIKKLTKQEKEALIKNHDLSIIRGIDIENYKLEINIMEERCSN